MQKYMTIYEQMIKENSELFDTFQSIHDAYALNPQLNQTKFNDIGKQVQEVIYEYERVLCGKTESGQYGKFSQQLSEKFWNVLRKRFPKIDFIGVEIS